MSGVSSRAPRLRATSRIGERRPSTTASSAYAGGSHPGRHGAWSTSTAGGFLNASAGPGARPTHVAAAERLAGGRAPAGRRLGSPARRDLPSHPGGCSPRAALTGVVGSACATRRRWGTSAAHLPGRRRRAVIELERRRRPARSCATRRSRRDAGCEPPPQRRRLGQRRAPARWRGRIVVPAVAELGRAFPGRAA